MDRVRWRKGRAKGLLCTLSWRNGLRRLRGASSAFPGLFIHTDAVSKRSFQTQACKSCGLRTAIVGALGDAFVEATVGDA